MMLREDRGTCPRCGSGEVAHLVIGMPAGPDVMQDGPEWEVWVGCVHPGHDRECRACGVVWTSVATTVDVAEDTWVSDLQSGFRDGECQSTVSFDDHPCAGAARWYAQLEIRMDSVASPHWEGKLCDSCLAGWRDWADEEPAAIRVVSVHPIVPG